MRHALLLLVMSTAACTSFDALGRNVCGNGLIEPGEDCDSSEASCVRCAVTCNAPADCPNAAYACGTDGLCHAPGGTLAAPASAGPFQVNDFAITDLGGDGTGDVVGLSRTSIVVRTGDPSGLLSRGVSIVTPFQTGRPAFADLDDDGSLDITMPTPDGLVTYASPLGDLTPMPVSSELAGANGNGGFELIGLYRISNEALGAFLSAPDGSVLVAVFDLVNGAFDQVVVPCNTGFKASAFRDSSFDVNRLTPDAAPSAELVMTLNGPTMAGANKTCVLAVTKNRNAKAALVDITPAAASSLAGRAVTADLDFDGDNCPALIAPTAAGVLRQWDGTRTSGNCTLAAASTVVTLNDVTAGATLVGRFPLTPNIALVAPDVLVMSDGVYANFLGTFTKVYASTRKIARAEVGDVNGDGRVDGIVASEGEDDIDILYRTQAPGYQLVRLDTASRVTSLTIGDYDGNGVDDIAYTELIDSYQRLEVAYCTPDRPLEPVPMGAFPNNISIVRFAIADTVDQQSLAADLVVLTLKTGARPPAVTVFHGSPQRTMMPYYDPTPAGPTPVAPHPYQLRGAVVGRFDGDSLRDVAGLGGASAGNTTGAPVRAWLMKGTSVGPDGSQTAGKAVSGITTCPRSTTDLCIESSLFLPIAGVGHDVVLAIDSSDPPRAAVLDPVSVNAQLVATAVGVTTGVPAGSVIRSAYTSDLDGDGSFELLASFAPRRGTTGAGAIRVCPVNAGTVATCDDLTSEIVAAVDGATACVDAAPGRFLYQDPFSAQRAGVSMVVLCRGAGVSMIERVTRSATGLEIAELARVPEVLDAIRVGDVTGDGVDDVAAIAVDHGSETLEVFRQCSSRDAAACTGGGK